MKTLDELVKLVEEANTLYRAGKESPLTDQEYDALKDAIRGINPNHSVLTKGRDDVWEPEEDCVHYSEKPLHMHMSSQQKALTWADMQKWFKDVDSTEKTLYHVSYKVDGLTAECKYVDGKLVQVLTGGDGKTGRDITRQVRSISNFPTTLNLDKGTVWVRGEIHMETKRFLAANIFLKQQNRPLLNAPRNAAVGIVRSEKNRDLVPFLSFRAFDFEAGENFPYSKENLFISDVYHILDELGFETPKGVWKDTEELKAYYEYVQYHRDNLIYEIDGLVVSLEKVDQVKALGYTNEDCPRGQIALKFPAKASFVTIKDIEWSFEGGLYASPVGVYDPTEISGAVCSRVSLKSLEWMETNRIGIGSVVQVVRSGDVIPTINTDLKDWLVFTPEQWNPKLVDQCPHCGSEVIRDGARLKCRNDECIAKEAARLEYFLKAMKVKGMATKTLREWVKAGVKLHSLFDLQEREGILNLLERYKSITPANSISMQIARKVLAQLEQAKPLPFAELMDAISVEGAGVLTWELFEQEGHDSPAKAMSLSIPSIAQVGKAKKKTIGEEIAKRIHTSLHSAGKQAVFRNFDTYWQKEKPQTNTHLKMDIASKNVCMTGTAPIPRAELQKALKAAGANVQSEVNASTDILFLSDLNSTTGKAKQAKALGVKICTYSELI